MLQRRQIDPVRSARDRSRRDAILAALAVAATAALAGIGAAIAIAAPDSSTGPAEPAASVPALDRASQLERSLGVGIARVRYAKLYEQADRLDVAPKRNLARTDAGRVALADGSAELRKEIVVERRKPDYGTPESVGIDRSTLDAIAACESGGDPTAVDPSGTYRGKYQFDLQTWASVGGSGDPAAAPEAEQDYRAALLMSRAGSSPWPNCG